MNENEFYYTDSRGIKGQKKRLYADFIVEEIRENRVCKAKAFLKEGFYAEKMKIPKKESEKKQYLHLDLEKINKDLHSVVRYLARYLHASKKRIGYAGLKDKRAVTCQRISIWNPEPEKIEKFKGKGIRLREPEWSEKEIKLGDLKGNKFTVTIRDINLSEKKIKKRVNDCFKQLKEKGLANLFGEQRFGGIRKVTHLVGREIINGNFENAVMLYLTASSPLEDEKVKEVRSELAKTRDYSTALRKLPKKYWYERAILNSLSKKENFTKALKALPLRMRFLFTHAYQSHLFNELIKKRVKKGIGLKAVENEPQKNGIALGLLPGYESSFSPGKIGEMERDLLEEERICFADFRVEKLKECSSKGTRRKMLVFPKKPELVKVERDKLFEGKMACIVSFELEKGTYATVLLKELMKPK